MQRPDCLNRTFRIEIEGLGMKYLLDPIHVSFTCLIPGCYLDLFGVFSRGRAECIPHKVRLAKLEMASAAQADSLPLRPSETSIQRVWPLWGVKHVKHRHGRNSQEAFEISILQSTLGRLNHCESVGFNCSVHPEGAM